ncbi:MAG: hypothetical protein OEW88_11005 [Gammaproteobacteria bacterium]|nr:hypothetical protein [Gammaproteobacteria bacterium]
MAVSEATSLWDLISGGPGKREGVRRDEVRNLLQQLPTTAAAALGPLLTSSDPRQQAFGQQQLQEFQRRRSPEAQQAMQYQQQAIEGQRLGQQSQRFGNLLAATQELRQQRLAPLQEQQMQGQLKLQGLQTQKVQNELIQQGLPVPAEPYGTPPKGHFPVLSPSGSVEYIPQPGTPGYLKAQEAEQIQARILKNLALLQSQIDDAGASGTELVGPRANNLRFLRGNVLADVAALRNLGVLQPAELENLEAQLPDPTSWGRNIGAVFSALDPTGSGLDLMRDSIQAPYTQMRRLFEDRLRQTRKTYWYVPATPMALPEDAQ